MPQTRLALLALILAIPVHARTLYWSSIDVDARLDSEGRLHVVERQTMVFDGDWNGGQRVFRLDPGQRIDLHSVTRIDPVTGAKTSLERGDLDQVDRYDWVDSNTLRWRSRLPSDPPFISRTLVYELDYTMRNIVVHREDDLFVLDHDFAFTDREGVIERFKISLHLEETWRPTTRFAGKYERTSMQPGENLIVTVPLQYVGPGSPDGVEMPAPVWLRGAPGVLLFLVSLHALVAFIRRERERGRFLPLVPAISIDEEWLNEHLFSIPPEVAGAAWDSEIDAPEVAAMLARMVAEGKLKSWTTSTRGMLSQKTILHLELLVDRDELPEPERQLIGGLFPGKRTTTSTDVIRDHYKNRGFNPASKIRKGVEKAVKGRFRKARNRDIPKVMATRTILVMFGLAIACGAGTAFLSPGRLLIVVISSILLGVAFLFISIPAGLTKNRVENAVGWIAVSSVLLVALVGVAIAVTIGQPLTLFATLAIDLLACFLFMVGLRIMATSNSRSQIELRKRLAAARLFLREQLHRPHPDLKDDWFPWIIGFGLGRHVDRWFRAFGGNDSTAIHATSGAISSSSSPARSGSIGGWTGGGGAFGGAGATSSWVSAARTMSSGVPSPSSGGSSGGGGGGGGGSSSGGGGGGGW